MSATKLKGELKSIFASLPKTERGKPIVLGDDPKNKKNFLYCNGNNVYIRDLQDPTKCDIYSEHTAHTSVGKYSPSGFYIASGDTTGKIRIWDTVNEEHLCKSQFDVLGGTIKDIDWSPDSQKVAVVGEGRDSYGKVITFDSGNTVGSIDCHSKSVNSVAYKQTRPFRIATASEDMTSAFFEGPPFKFKVQNHEHTNFVNCVRYQPSGEVYVTGGADGKLIVYDGKTGECMGTIGGDKAHKGGIYAISFSPDGNKLLSVSGDKTAKIWDMSSKSLVTEYTFGKEITDMQVGCLWQGDNIMTVSLSGYINYLDENDNSAPRRIQKGHNRPITAMAVADDGSQIYTTSVGLTTEATILGWNTETGESKAIQGKGHANQIVEMVIRGDTLFSVSWDDTVRFTSLSSNTYDSTACKLPSQPTRVDGLADGRAVVTCRQHIVVADKGNIMFQQEVKFEPCSVSIHPGGTTVAIGGKEHCVHIFEMDGTSMKGVKKVELKDEVNDVKFSPDGAYLAVVTNAQRKILLYSLPDYTEVYGEGKHTARIFSVAWNPSSQMFATASLDGSICVWSLDPGFQKSLLCYIKDAHKKSDVKKIHWLSDNALVSTGSDSNVKQWVIKE